MSLLTLDQLMQWRDRVHQEYVEVLRAHDRAIRKERLYRRYAIRFLEEQDRINREKMNAQSS